LSGRTGWSLPRRCCGRRIDRAGSWLRARSLPRERSSAPWRQRCGSWRCRACRTARRRRPRRLRARGSCGSPLRLCGRSGATTVSTGLRRSGQGLDQMRKSRIGARQCAVGSRLRLPCRRLSAGQGLRGLLGRRGLSRRGDLDGGLLLAAGNGHRDFGSGRQRRGDAQIDRRVRRRKPDHAPRQVRLDLRLQLRSRLEPLQGSVSTAPLGNRQRGHRFNHHAISGC